MAQKKSKDTGFRKQLLVELQSNVRGGLRRVSGNEILLTPLMDVYETAGEFVLVFAVPGMGRDDMEVKIIGNELFVEEKKGAAKKITGELVLKEVEHGRYSRKIQLAEDIEVEEQSMNGTIDKGILTITLKKKKADVSEEAEAGDGENEKEEPRGRSPRGAGEGTAAGRSRTKSKAKSRK